MRRTSEPLLLLDTHIWLWLVQGNRALAPRIRESIREAAATGRLRVAAISIWEVALLASRGRITLERPSLVWVRDALARSGAVLEPLSPEIAIHACELPDRFHPDPADRMIVATARVIDASLMTRDRPILDYAARGHINAVAA